MTSTPLTDHSAFDYAFIVTHSPIIVDTRNACAHILIDRDKIILL